MTGSGLAWTVDEAVKLINKITERQRHTSVGCPINIDRIKFCQYKETNYEINTDINGCHGIADFARGAGHQTHLLQARDIDPLGYL